MAENKTKKVLSERTDKLSEGTKEECISDLRSVQEHCEEKFISRSFYRSHGAYADSTWSRYFGTFREFRRQAGLELSRQQHQLETHIARHASVDHYRKYYEDEILPCYRKYEKEHLPTKVKRLMIASDIHDEEADDFTLSVFIAECERKQPDIIVLNGDIFDLLEFGQYKIDPRHVRIKERFDFVHERVFGPLRDACPDAQIDFIMGNHEFRLISHLANATPNVRILLSDVMGISFSQVFGLDKYEINWVSKFDLSAFSKSDARNEVKKGYQIYFDCFAVTHEPDSRLMKSMSGTNGHHHRASLVSEANAIFGSITWTQTPAIHVTDAEYLKNLSGWNKGFLEVVIDTEKKQVIQKIHQCHDTWSEVDGVYYHRRNPDASITEGR